MADEGGSGDNNSGILFIILILLFVLVVNVPLASEIVFQWIPATVDVISGGTPAGDGNVATSAPTVVLTSSEDTQGNPRIELNDEDESSSYLSDFPYSEEGSLFSLWSVFVPISIFTSLILAMGLLYSAIRVVQIRKREKIELKESRGPVLGGNITKAQMTWHKIVDQSQSTNPNDWRLSIIEADVMLDELLDVQGYTGDTMADKMKQVELSDFNTIDDAWEAHKARNRIAHEGSRYELNQREVRRIIELYERVFREFHFI
ncbi:MAG: hypothetical protein COW88_01115 [Candidatus Lloydbacteria bacterium CG22_combo_CG10-13_8_21_14_all_47_15]|uniref:Uncharacterized protein n=1 Tax=Candidatus Lloydbacteria bacterium CG22_combo_CG10-13_8_21_14_all_47_15 TaxID=1974635 RepID=A0A2H0CUX4_9BACT|nr:MAG: hypothetical protein COW88_01115 [Candidatus Lloydbacteria bacterium CG22_combo_CG10-13_8_21_14_all_47_15]